jgi:septation ring formation regulator EzrA
MSELSRELEKIEDAYRQLSELGYSFYVTGNYKVSVQLFNLADCFKGAPQRISSLVNEATMRDLDKVNNQLRSIMNQTFDKGES